MPPVPPVVSTPSFGNAAPPPPGYAQPLAPQVAPAPQGPGYPTSPAGYVPPGQQAYIVQSQPTGAVAWGMGFIACILIPFLSVLVAGIVMRAVYGSQARKGPLAEANARSAANWGLTLVFVSTGLLVLHFVLLFVLTSDGSTTGFYPLGIPLTLYAAIVLLHLILTVVGTIRARAGKVVRIPFAIPFVRKPSGAL